MLDERHATTHRADMRVPCPTGCEFYRPGMDVFKVVSWDRSGWIGSPSHRLLLAATGDPNTVGPYKHGLGKINVPIVPSTLVVEPGDLMFGDDEGILSVPIASADAVLAKAQAKMRHEADHIEKLRTGQPNRSWIDRSIESLRG